MKNFNILGVHWEIWFLGGFTKNQYRGGLLNRAAWTVYRFKRGLARKRGGGGGVFEEEGGDTLMHTMIIVVIIVFDW